MSETVLLNHIVPIFTTFHLKKYKADKRDHKFCSTSVIFNGSFNYFLFFCLMRVTETRMYMRA